MILRGMMRILLAEQFFILWTQAPGFAAHRWIDAWVAAIAARSGRGRGNGAAAGVVGAGEVAADQAFGDADLAALPSIGGKPRRDEY